MPNSMTSTSVSCIQHPSPSVQPLQPTSARIDFATFVYTASMPLHELATEEERNAASWQGVLGGINGAARWGFYSAVIAGAAFYFSPVYRGLTLQFKIYLQMSGMTIGGCVEAERRMREHEQRTRRMRKIRRDAEVWRRYEQDYSGQNTGRTVAEKPVKNE